MQVLRCPMDKINTEEREEGEITEQTEYSDISSDEEELLLRQRIAEIEATNLELEKLATLSNEVDEKENAFGNGKKWTQEVVALTNGGKYIRSSNSNGKKAKRSVPYAKKRKRSRRIRRQSVQLIISDDEFDTYDTLPLGTENLSPDPLPIGDDDEENDEDLELKLRLEALQSKQEIKNELQVILEQTSCTEHGAIRVTPVPEIAHPPVDEEQELRLIALKSAVVKKHLVRKKKKEEARPYSPTDDALENFDVPSPPLSVQNMDISPLGTPSPLSENNNAVDMEIANEESQSPIFFACTINTEPSVALSPTASALSRVEFQIDRDTIKTGSGGDDDDEEDPDQLRALLLAKIEEVAKRKSMRVESDSLTEEKAKSVNAKKVISHRHSDSNQPSSIVVEEETNVPSTNPTSQTSILKIRAIDSDDEHVLRANLLSKAKRLKRAKSEENIPVLLSQKPLSEILNEQSKKALELKTICRTIENNTVANDVVLAEAPLPPEITVLRTTTPPSRSPKPVTPTRNALISELRPIKVNPVIISLASDGNTDSSTFEDSDEEMSVDVTENCNRSPLSIAMDSPLHSSSPLPEKAATAEGKENFDSKLSEFLKKARQSVTTVGKPIAGVQGASVKRIVTSKRIVKKVIGISKTVGLANAVQFGATPPAVKHLPPSTQLEYNRLIKRMHHLERQKQLKGLSQPVVPKNPSDAKLTSSPIRPTSKLTSKGRPSPVKAPLPPPPATLEKPGDGLTLIRRTVEVEPKKPVVPITVQIKNNAKDVNESGAVTLVKNKISVIPITEKKPAAASLIKATKLPVVASSPAALGTVQVAAPGKPTAAIAPNNTPNRLPGRVTLKERLNALTEEQKKMLLDVQHRKVVNKRKSLYQSLDAFLTTVRGSMTKNRQQIRMELEVRRLRKLLRQKEELLEAQRQLCNGTLHERLHCQHKAVIVARQSLTTTSAQCMEIGRSVVVAAAGEAGDFRLTEEGTEGLGLKFKQYKGEIAAYKDLRDKIRRGVFTLADSKEMVGEAKVVAREAAAVVASGEESATKSLCSAEEITTEKGGGPPKAICDAVDDEPTEAIRDGGEAGPVTKTTPPMITEDKEGNQGMAVEESKLGEASDGGEQPGTTIKTTVPEYKSPLEHMEFLETANPNGIICPFELNGSCQDEECSYRHLAASTAPSSS